jgi:AhpD family alkylhydroperoxidase
MDFLLLSVPRSQNKETVTLSRWWTRLVVGTSFPVISDTTEVLGHCWPLEDRKIVYETVVHCSKFGTLFERASLDMFRAAILFCRGKPPSTGTNILPDTAMLNDWRGTLKNLRAAATGLANANSQAVSAYRALNGALDAKTCELIALAVAVTTRCDGCINSHASAAREAGATEAELSEALGTAIALNAGAAYVYSVRAMDAFGQFKRETAVS